MVLSAMHILKPYAHLSDLSPLLFVFPSLEDPDNALHPNSTYFGQHAVEMLKQHLV